MMKMLLTGEQIKANYAKEIGLINDHFSKSKLNKEVLKVAKNIASKSNLTIKICKSCKKSFTWRKKWQKDWENVLYCSKKCSKKK